MKDYKYLFDKNIEINLTANDNSINYKDNANITSINKNFKSPYSYNLLLPSYNPKQYKDEKSSSLINKFLNKKEDFFKEKNDYNENKISKLKSKYSTCNNYYPRKNYNKFLNSHQQTNSSIINNTNLYHQNTTFEGINGYNKLNTRDLIEITKRRKQIIEQKKIKDEEKQKEIENNLNNLENIDIIINKNLNKSGGEEKKFCDEEVQTSLVNINEQEIENNNKKEEPLSTIIFTDKSALINQEITFLSIQYSLKNNGDNIEDSKEYRLNDNDFVNIGSDTKDSIYKEKDKFQNKDKINNKKSDNKGNKKTNKNAIIVSNNSTEQKNKNTNIVLNNSTQQENKNKNDIINKDNSNIIRSNDINNNKIKIHENINEKNNDENIKNIENKDKDLAFTIINNTEATPSKKEREDENYMTSAAETFQIESNEKTLKQNNNNNGEDNNFTITNNNMIKMNNKEENKILNDSLEEESKDDNFNLIINTNKSKSLSNSDENELTEVEEYDQNLIFLQNESKTMTSHFDKMRNNKTNEEIEENKANNKDNILIEDTFNNRKNNLKESNDNDEDNIEKCLDSLNKEKDDSLNNIASSLNKNIKEVYSVNNRISYKENIFRAKGRKNNSLNKYNDYPTLRNINDNNSLKSKLFNNNCTNNNRYQKNYQNYEENNNECFDLLKLKTADLKLNNQEEKIAIKPLKKSNDNNNKQNIVINNNNQIDNNKFFSDKKLNININNNNKNNISGIPINPNKPKSNIIEIKNNININKEAINNNNIKNYLITPRCFKKKRQLNNYAEYYKLKMSMCKDDSINNVNNYSQNNHNKNYKSLGHKKSYDNFNK